MCGFANSQEKRSLPCRLLPVKVLAKRVPEDVLGNRGNGSGGPDEAPETVLVPVSAKSRGSSCLSTSCGCDLGNVPFRTESMDAIFVSHRLEGL
jgi:hypothetical protein